MENSFKVLTLPSVDSLEEAISKLDENTYLESIAEANGHMKAIFSTKKRGQTSNKPIYKLIHGSDKTISVELSKLGNIDYSIHSFIQFKGLSVLVLQYTNNLTENAVDIIQTNPIGDFVKSHGNKYVPEHGIYLVGLRGRGRLLVYTNMDDLSERIILDIPGVTPVTEGIEAICYCDVVDKVFFPISNTNKIVSIDDMENLSNFTVHTISGMGSLKFSGSSPIMSDGTHIYIHSETSNTPTIFKIRISDYALIDSEVMDWGNGSGAHTGTISPDKLFGYFGNNGSNGYSAKVQLSNLTVVESKPTGLNSITDDMLYLDGFPFTDHIVLLQEFPAKGNRNVAIIDASTMEVVLRVDVMPSFGAIYNSELGIIYFLTNGIGHELEGESNGGIEVLDLNKVTFDPRKDKNITTVYPLRGIQPNEGFMIPVEGGEPRLFITSWNDSTNKSNLLEIALRTPINSANLTKWEFVNRYNMGLPHAIYKIESQTFEGFTGVTELVNDLGINFTFTPFDTGKINCPEFIPMDMCIQSIQLDTKSGPIGKVICNTNTAGANLWVVEDKTGDASDDIFFWGGIIIITKIA